MTTDSISTNSTLHTSHQYIDHVRSSANNTTTLLHHSLSSHSFEQESPTKTLSDNLNSNNLHDTINADSSLLPFDDDDDDEEEENNTHNIHRPHHHIADPAILTDSDQVLNETHKADIHNLSDYSLAPVRLMTTFEDTYSKFKQPQPNDSPTDVKSFNDNNNINSINKKNNNNNNNNNNTSKEDSISEYKMELPHFHLTDKLSLTLPHPTIDRISFYGVVFGVNREIHDMARDEHHHPIEDTNVPSSEEESPLVHAVLGPNPTPQSHTVPSQQGQIAILDEEQFLLAVIRSRTPEEKSVRACPTSFAEAIGEVEVDVIRENGQTPNPLSVLAPSRTQLWKPSRSWWEAKSGKNPWIEPKSHNKRWRYLWPLIHYHKFLAKCIKKLKRNSIDVKTCHSPVSTFLRSEVCAVSNHLASSSRFTSEQWMDGLPEFHGWIPKDSATERRIRDLVANLPIRSLGEPVNWKSPLLRSQIDKCFLLAMEADKGQMVVDGFGEGRVREERFDSNEGEYPVVGYGRDRVGSNGTNSSSNGGEMGYTRPPKAKPPKKIPGSATKQRRPKKRVTDMNAMNGRYNSNPMGGWNRPGQQMMPPHSHMQHGMYPPQYTNHYAGQPPPPNAYATGNGYSFGNSIGAPPNMYGGSDDYTHHPQAEWGSHQMNANMHYYNRWDQPQMGNDVQYFHQPASGPIATWTTHEEAPLPQPHYPEQPPQTYNPAHLPHTSSETNDPPEKKPTPTVITNPALMEVPRRDFLQTPSKPRYNNSEEINQSTIPPDSPYWAHLGFSTLAMSGLATPQGSVHRSASPLTRVDNGEGGGVKSGRTLGGGRRGNIAVQASKPLLLNAPYSYHHQGNAMNVPPSPATQFLMSPQTNSRTTAFFAQTQMNPAFPPASPHHHNHHHHPSQHHPIQEQMAVQQQTCTPDSPESSERVKKGVSTPKRVVEMKEVVEVRRDEEVFKEDEGAEE